MTQQNDEILEQAGQLAQRLRTAGYAAYFVGGVVRDMLLEKPVADVDIATDARPDEIVAIFPNGVTVGAQFGVIKVPFRGNVFDIATFRSDGVYIDGRRPETVAFTNAAGDVARRDFTINGLLYDPVGKKIIDHVGGRADLKKRVVRAIGDARTRFTEDKLRMLRAVRFSARFDFEIEAQTYAAIVELAPLIAVVSAERIRDELVKMLTGPYPAKALDLLRGTGLLHAVLPEVAATIGVRQPPEFHPEGDVFEHTRLLLELLPADPPVELALAALLHDVGKPATQTFEDRIRFNNHPAVGARLAKNVMERLRFPNSVTESVVDVTRRHMDFKHVREMRPSKLKRFIRQDNFAIHLDLHRLDCLASHGNTDNYEFLIDYMNHLAPEVVKPPPLIDGYDLIELGGKPGPLFATILKEIEDGQLDGEIVSREQALAAAKIKLAAPGE